MADALKEESCSTCRFRRPMPEHDTRSTVYTNKNGICHRFPGGGPHVGPDDWCGEYKQLPVHRGK